MLRLAFLLALVAVASPSAMAQFSFDLGVAGGVNFANLEEAGTLDLDRAVGYHVGLYLDVGLLAVSARTGVYYIDVGAFPESFTESDDTAAFVAVPLDFQFRTPTPFVQAYALVGPEVRFPIDGLDTFPVEDYVFAANVGLGVRGGVPLIGPSGFIEGRYGFDLTGLRDTTAPDNVKVHLIQIRVGVGI